MNLPVEPTPERAATHDGVLLGMRRYPRPGAPPVLLLHGLAQNLNGWDLPVKGHSLARFLSSAGLDVWLGNLRGHGRDPHRSGTGARAARIDDYGLLDLPGFIGRVQKQTGRAPLVVGHSMGGIAAIIYLEGAQYDADGRVVSDAELAAERNAGIAGIVLVAVPPILHWHAQPGLTALLRGNYFEYNALLQRVLSRRPVRALLDRLPQRAMPGGQLARIAERAAALPTPLGQINAAALTVAGQVVSSMLAHTLWNPANMNRTLVDAETRNTLDSASIPVLRQFSDWIAHGTAREYTVDDPHRPPFVYADDLDRVRVPVLMVGGDLDRVAPASVIRSHGLRRIGSEDRSLLVLRGFGHNDLRVGVRAPVDLYPRISAWLADRAAHTRLSWRGSTVDLVDDLA